MAKYRIGLLAPLALAMPGAAHAQEAAPDSASLRLSLGGTYASGDYGGTATTRVYSAPLSLRLSQKRFTLRVTVPFVRIEGPGTLVDSPQGRDGGAVDSGVSGSDDGIGGTETETEIEDDSGSGGGGGDDCTPVEAAATSGSDDNSGGSGGSGSDDGGGQCQTERLAAAALIAGPSGSRSGLGDVSVALGYGLDLGTLAQLDLGARIKVPTASRAKGLGTGKTDVTLSATLSRHVGPVTLWGGARRRLVGKALGLRLRDTWGASGGVSLRASSAISLGVDYDWQQSVTGRRPFSELTGWAGVSLNQRLRLNAYAGAGLNQRSANFLGGLTLTWKLN
ncbi:hypothetical protein [Novosphingobium cyanobacteriorum]|uniref:Outer membrane protein beta-barrel domain-containing protein n=1 Tax=Novosphingobium cyanobacteriorum TaxID=3024215 RepID=A0ABT6CCU8_9SPHN|nr:hypothetical protein [Novosphingobium cyanobacteriorum]MDF8331762.1 hypothetical protein [Novosphingobium cyanobacteriorum]